jgi:hypothetical protein
VSARRPNAALQIEHHEIGEIAVEERGHELPEDAVSEAPIGRSSDV